MFFNNKVMSKVASTSLKAYPLVFTDPITKRARDAKDPHPPFSEIDLFKS